MSKRALPKPHPTFLRITHTLPHCFLTRSYLFMPPNCHAQSWRLASTQQDNPASFFKVPTCRHRSQSSVSLRIWSGTPSLLLEARHPQAGFGEGLHRTRHCRLAVLKRRSASLWPNTNRWFFGKASTRSSIHDTTRYHFTSTTGCFTARAINSPCHQEALPPYPKK